MTTDSPTDSSAYLQAQSVVHDMAAQLLQVAADLGVVVTIETQPKPGQPLAMSRYNLVVSTRPARKGQPA